ncbi:MAG: hypothetical protein IPP94_16525 [Ignavibacteria bacterium]|nr:hypothetical protein [Ignavibacteria bacterium]
MARILLFMFVCGLLLLQAQAQAQDGAGSAVRVSGGVTVTGDVYGFQSTPDSAEQGRRPPSLFRLVFNPTITIGEYITLPFNIMLSSSETNVVTPNAKNSSFLQFIQNPMNSLGFLSFSPRAGWAQAHLGSHVPSYSELSTGDEQVFGAGIDLTPGLFRFALSAGSSQRAIQPDSAASVRGAYARQQYAAKIGYGSETTFGHLNFVRAKDDPASIARVPAGVMPQEGMVLSTNFRIALTDAVGVFGEAAASAFTRDMRSADIEGDSPVPQSMYRQRESSRSDYAGTFGVDVNNEDWGVRLSSKYIGAGYSTLAFPYLQPDRLEFLAAPRVRFFDQHVNITGSVGYRTNNLSKTNGATTTQLIGSANVLVIATDDLSISARYANFGIRNNLVNDTLKLETVTNSVSISPSYTLRTEGAVHSMTAIFSIDAFTDYNVVSGRQGSNNTQTLMGVYSVSFMENPLSISVTGSRMTNDLPVSKLLLYSASFNASYRLFEGALLPSLGLSWSSNALGAFTPDRQLLGRFAVQWAATKSLALNVAVSRNDYRYGSSRPGVAFVELFLESSASWRF